MKVISLGFTCYIKSLIQLTSYASETDFFDWMNTFYFKKLLKCIEDGGTLFDSIESSKLEVDQGTKNLYNPIYDFRLPHDTVNSETIKKYNRRFERLLNYKIASDKCLFIRIINVRERYGKPPESLLESYSKESYEQLLNFIPQNAIVLLITDIKLSTEDKNCIYEKFIVLDNVLNPEFCFFGNHMKYKTRIVGCYNNLFNYIDKHYESISSTDIQTLQNFISNEKLLSP